MTRKKSDDKMRKTGFFDYQTDRNWADNLAIVTQLGLTMIGCIIFCFFVGHYLDRWTGFRGVFTTLFLLLGIAGGANVCYRQITEVTDPKPQDGPDDHRANNS